MIKAVIFDMDGTTVNSLGSISYFANRALKKFGLAEIEEEKYKLFAGNGAGKLVERMIKATGGSEEQREKVLEEYNSTYDKNFLHNAKPYDGIVKLLKTLKKQGIKTAIVSNKPHSTAEKISTELFGNLIDICVGAKDGVPLKPNPEAVISVMKKIGAEAEECLYVGDTAVDMQTGKNANLFTVGVLWGFRDKTELIEGGADAIISSPDEILKYIK